MAFIQRAPAISLVLKSSLLFFLLMLYKIKAREWLGNTTGSVPGSAIRQHLS